MVSAKTETDFLVEAMIATRGALVELAEIWLGDAEDAGGTEGLFDDVETTEVPAAFHMDGVEEDETEIVIIYGDALGDAAAVTEYLVGLDWVKRGDEDEWDVYFFGDATSVGSENAEAATTTDAIVCVIKLDGPVCVWAVGAEFFYEMGTIYRRVELFDFFDVV